MRDDRPASPGTRARAPGAADPRALPVLPVLPVLLAHLLAMAGCGHGHAPRILDDDCVLGEEHTLALPDGPLVDDLALAEVGERRLAAWSERAGAFVREIGADGAPRGEPLRLGPDCTAGLAVSAQGEALAVACGRQGDDARDDPGGVQLLTVRDRQIHPLGSFGPTGPDGAGVAVAASGDQLVVGWQEARGAIRSTWIQRVADGAQPERLSAPALRGTRPALLFHDGDLTAAWGETGLDPSGDVVGRVELQVGSRPARPVSELAYETSLPVLRAGVEGDLVLGFRDRRPDTARPRFFLGRVRDRAIERLEGAAPANAEGEAVPVACGGDVFVVAPRTHSHTERLVSVRRHARSLEGLGPEEQIYEHGAVFDHADVLCVGGDLLILYAGRATRLTPRASVRAVRMRCRRPQ